MVSEGKVLQGVLVAAVHLGVGGEAPQLLHGRVHHLRCSLEESSAAADEESVPSEDDPVRVLGDVVADMPGGVAGGEQTGDLDVPDGVLGPVLHVPEVITVLTFLLSSFLLGEAVNPSVGP